MYDRGEGVPQSYREALKWYRKAADQGDSTAQYNLGFMYASGHGVPQDDATAHMWFDLSAARGDDDAAKNRDVIAQRMTPAQIAEAQKLAREWKLTFQSHYEADVSDEHNAYMRRNGPGILGIASQTTRLCPEVPEPN
jgi:TPR repeat protein